MFCVKIKLINYSNFVFRAKVLESKARQAVTKQELNTRAIKDQSSNLKEINACKESQIKVSNAKTTEAESVSHEDQVDYKLEGNLFWSREETIKTSKDSAILYRYTINEACIKLKFKFISRLKCNVVIDLF